MRTTVLLLDLKLCRGISIKLRLLNEAFSAFSAGYNDQLHQSLEHLLCIPILHVKSLI